MDKSNYSFVILAFCMLIYTGSSLKSKSYTACYGILGLKNYLQPSCPRDQKMVVVAVYALAKHKSTGCPQVQIQPINPSCCQYDPEDCSVIYDSGPYRNYYDTCNGKLTCAVPVSWIDISSHCNTSVYIERTHYMKMDYYCISEHAVDPCTDLTTSDSPTFFWNSGYPADMTSTSTSCTFSIEMSCDTTVQLTAIDLQLKDTGNCKQSFSVTDGNSYLVFDCSNNNDFLPNTIYTSSGHFLKILFINNLGTTGGKYLIQVQGSNPTGKVTLSCGASASTMSSQNSSTLSACSEEGNTTSSLPTILPSTPTEDSSTVSPTISLKGSTTPTALTTGDSTTSTTLTTGDSTTHTTLTTGDSTTTTALTIGYPTTPRTLTTGDSTTPTTLTTGDSTTSTTLTTGDSTIPTALTTGDSTTPSTLTTKDSTILNAMITEDPTIRITLTTEDSTTPTTLTNEDFITPTTMKTKDSTTLNAMITEDSTTPTALPTEYPTLPSTLTVEDPKKLTTLTTENPTTLTTLTSENPTTLTILTSENPTTLTTLATENPTTLTILTSEDPTTLTTLATEDSKTPTSMTNDSSSTTTQSTNSPIASAASFPNVKTEDPTTPTALSTDSTPLSTQAATTSGFPLNMTTMMNVSIESTSDVAPEHSTPPQTSTGLPTVAATQPTTNIIQIVLPAVFGGIAALSFIVGFFWCCRKKRARSSDSPFPLTNFLKKSE